MTRKAQTSLPFAAIYATVAMLLVIGVAYGSQVYAADFMRKNLVDIQADRAANAALALKSMPAGHIELKLKSYEFKWNDAANNVTIAYEGTIGTQHIDSDYFKDITGPTTLQKVENKICLKKTDEDKLKFSMGEC
ncbi:MAG: hypothetical protein ABEJ69_00890 [Candidatus Nanohaloarchaea archaeon]